MEEDKDVSKMQSKTIKDKVKKTKKEGQEAGENESG